MGGRPRQKVTTKRLSICPCGFPVLDESIPLGTEYEVDPELEERVTFICGGCGAEWSIVAIYAYSRGNSRGGFMPKMLFFKSDGW